MLLNRIVQKTSNIVPHTYAPLRKTSIRFAVLVCLPSLFGIAYAADKPVESPKIDNAATTGWCVSDHPTDIADANQACVPDLTRSVSGYQQTRSELPLLLAQATTEQAPDPVDAEPEENDDLTSSSPDTAIEQNELDASDAEADAAESSVGALLQRLQARLGSLSQRLQAKLGSLSQGMLATLILGVTLPIVLLLAFTTRFFKSEQRAADASDYEYYQQSENHHDRPVDDQIDYDDVPTADTRGYDESAVGLQDENGIEAFESPDEAIYESDSDNPAGGDDEMLESLNLIDEVFSDTSDKVKPEDDPQLPAENADLAHIRSHSATSENASDSQALHDGVAETYPETRQNEVTGQHPDIFDTHSAQNLEDLDSVEQTSSAVDSLYDDFNQTYIEEVPAYHIDLPQDSTPQAPVKSPSGNSLAQSRTKQIAERERAIHSAHWLSREPVQMQKDYVIDYLVYWMAHADKRFAPAAEKKVLQMKNPGTRDLIKRDVFLNNAYAYSMVINIVQTQMTIVQRKQILDLLMALLVVEHALTPIQNNLLRFLADAFGIGASGIKSQFERAFGYPMPAIPRPDKLIWWKQINNEHTLRWNARAIARLPEQVRDRILLGQSLDGEIRAASVIQSFKLAEDRCQPDCVDKLGERAQALLKSRSKKFATARDNLLETIS